MIARFRPDRYAPDGGIMPAAGSLAVVVAGSGRADLSGLEET